MEERNANNPKGVDMGPRRVVNRYHGESILTAIPASFAGGAVGMSSRDAFTRGSFANAQLNKKERTTSS